MIVRCLGPGPEHSFKSRDRINNRLCDKCTKVIKAMPTQRAVRPTPRKRPC